MENEDGEGRKKGWAASLGALGQTPVPAGTLLQFYHFNLA